MVAVIALPTVLTMLILLVLMRIRVAPHIEMEAVVRRLTLRAATVKPWVVMEPIAARAITLRGFEEWRALVSSLEAAKSQRYDARADRYSASAWNKLEGGLLALEPSRGLRSKLQLEAVGEGKLMVLDRLYGASGATYDVTKQGRLTVEMSRQPLRWSITLPELVRVRPDLCLRLQDAKWAWSDDAVTLQIRPSNVPAEVTAKDLPLTITMMPELVASPVTLLADVPVDVVELVDQAYSGEAESTLSGVGSIRFVGYPNSMAVPLEARTFVEMDGLKQFYTRELTLEGNTQLRLKLSGAVEKLRVGPKGAVTDRRPSAVEALRYNPAAATVFGLVSWVIPTLVAARKYMQDKS